MRVGSQLIWCNVIIQVIKDFVPSSGIQAQPLRHRYRL